MRPVPMSILPFAGPADTALALGGLDAAKFDSGSDFWIRVIHSGVQNGNPDLLMRRGIRQADRLTQPRYAVEEPV